MAGGGGSSSNGSSNSSGGGGGGSGSRGNAPGGGLVLLFHGASGVGKTMMANAVAHHVGKKGERGGARADLWSTLQTVPHAPNNGSRTSPPPRSPAVLSLCRCVSEARPRHARVLTHFLHACTHIRYTHSHRLLSFSCFLTQTHRHSDHAVLIFLVLSHTRSAADQFPQPGPEPGGGGGAVHLPRGQDPRRPAVLRRVRCSSWARRAVVLAYAL